MLGEFVLGAENRYTCSFKNFLGDDALRPHVTFSRRGIHYCVYCGNISDTREHAPSRVFLSKPYPEEDLPVLPACQRCNNGFSNDELYTEVYIATMKYLSGYSDSLSEQNQERIYQNTAFSDAQNDLSKYYKEEKIPTNEKVVRILTKLAICHMVYELSEGYCINDACIEPTSVSYSFAFDMTTDEKEPFDSFIFMNDKIVPEIGSRVFDKIFVLEPVLQRVDNGEQSKLPMLIMNWSDIQEHNYRYIAWLENDNSFHVRIVIHDFLYAEIVFDRSI